MVDLVKVRKKAKEKKASEVHEVLPETAAPVEKEGSAVESASPDAPVSAASAHTETEPKAEKAVPSPPSPEMPTSAKLAEFKRTVNANEGAGTRDAAAGEITSDAIMELLLFTIAGEQYALTIDKIVEIVPPRRATRVPNADDAIVGIISLRGTIVSILDIRRRLGHPPLQTTGPDSRIIVVENDGETAGFLVDRVSRVVRVEPSRIGSHPVVNATEQSIFIRGVFQHAQRLSILLDLEKLLRYQEHIDAWS